MLVLRGFSTSAADFVACLKEFDKVPRDWAIKSSAFSWSLWGSSGRVARQGNAETVLQALVGRMRSAVHPDGIKRPYTLLIRLLDWFRWP